MNIINLINSGVLIEKIGLLSVLFLFILDLNIFTDLRGIMFDFAIGRAHPGRKKREIRQHSWKGIIDFVTLRKLPEYVKINKRIFDQYYKLHSIMLISIPIQYLVIIMGRILDGNVRKAAGYFCIVVIVIKIIIDVVLLSKLDSSKVSKYAKKEYKKTHKEREP